MGADFKEIWYFFHSERSITMAIGERIHFFRTKRGMTQKYVGGQIGFDEKSADVRMAQYEKETRVPKDNLIKALADIFDVNPEALKVPDIDSYVVVPGIVSTVGLEDRLVQAVEPAHVTNVHVRVVAEDASGNVITNTQSGGVNPSTVPANGQWIFEEAGEANVYYLKNANSGQYAQALARSTVLKTGSTPVGYTLHTIGTGLFSLRYNGAASNTLHSAAGVSYKVVGWDDNEDPSQWYITMVSKDEVIELRQELAALTEKTQQLIDRMATVSPKGSQDMSGFAISSNAPELVCVTECGCA